MVAFLISLICCVFYFPPPTSIASLVCFLPEAGLVNTTQEQNMQRRPAQKGGRTALPPAPTQPRWSCVPLMTQSSRAQCLWECEWMCRLIKEGEPAAPLCALRLAARAEPSSIPSLFLLQAKGSRGRQTAETQKEGTDFLSFLPKLFLQ